VEVRGCRDDAQAESTIGATTESEGEGAMSENPAELIQRVADRCATAIVERQDIDSKVVLADIGAAACAAIAAGFETSLQTASNLVVRELLMRIDLRLGPHIFDDHIAGRLRRIEEALAEVYPTCH
jgi:hypothetical protein